MDELKYLIMCILSAILAGVFIVIQIVDPKLWTIIMIAIAIIATIGSLILYIQERKENHYINKTRKKSGKRFK